MAYKNQSDSLRYVQQYGPELERSITEFLEWPGGRVIYLQRDGLTYDLQVDACWPNVNNPKTFVSVTYCKPDVPGHSNENKLQLKLGELMLLKAKYPDIRAVLVVGGNKNTWLSYVLQVFDYFFDEVIYMWDKEVAEERLKAIRDNPEGITIKHSEIWKQLSDEWKQRILWTANPINSKLRLGIWELISEIGVEGDVPSSITNSIMRRCMETAYEASIKTRNNRGTEWGHYLNQDWDSLWQSRSFFNPSEAAIQLALEQAKFAFRGGLARDVSVPSLLHHLRGEAVARTKVSEDFVLFSRKFNQPVFIQSKASGGGIVGHGKNIQNRTKEQLSRSLFYRGVITPHGELSIRPQDFIWLAVLDGDWGVTKRSPLKYIHMLQLAGYQYLLPADSLVNDYYELLEEDNNPLSIILKDLDCYTERSEFEEALGHWLSQRMPQLREQARQQLLVNNQIAELQPSWEISNSEDD